MKINKRCEGCSSDLINVNHQTRYCDNCKEANIKKSTKKYKKKTRTINSKNKEKELIDNFNNIVKESYQLTTLGFNEVSKISFHAYKNLFKIPWVEILKLFNKYDELIDYILREYDNYINKTGKQGFREFTDNHEYISSQLLKTIGYDNIRDMLNIRKRRNTLEECKTEFLRLVSLYGRIPLYSEFLKDSKITLKSYICHLNLTGKKLYDQIVKYFVSEEEYIAYLTDRLNHKSTVGKENHQGYKYSDKELKSNLISIFDNYFNKYETYPTRRIFNNISPIDNSIYTHRFNKKWSEVCLDYGYDIEGKQYKSEKVALEIVSEILNAEYKPQKTFEWLIGFKGFPLFCDGYFPSHSLIIEFDGDQHRYPNEWFGGLEVFNNIKTNDKYKDVLIPRNGLKLVRISSEEPFWNKEYIKNKLIQNNISIPTPTQQ